MRKRLRQWTERMRLRRIDRAIRRAEQIRDESFRRYKRDKKLIQKLAQQRAEI